MAESTSTAFTKAVSVVAPEPKICVRFHDEEDRLILLELIPAGVVHCYVNGRHKVNKVNNIWADGRTLHIEGKRLLSSACVATVPREGCEGMTAKEVILAVMELFGRRAQTPDMPKGSMRLVVWVASARGLRDADGLPGQGSSDPYCACEILGKAHTRFTTKFIKNTLNPMWDHVAEVSPWAPGDRVAFTVWDKDWCSKDDFLGKYELSLPKGLFPKFEGEVPLALAGKGIQAFLKVCVFTGTREERERWRLKSDLRRATLPEHLDEERLQAMLEEAKAMGLSPADRAAGEALLRVIKQLHEACLKRERAPLQAALEEVAKMGLGQHSIAGAAQEVFAEVEVRDRIEQALREHRGLDELQAAVTAGKELGLNDADYGNGPDVLFRLHALMEACRGEDDAARIIQAIEAAAGLRAWPEYELAREHGVAVVTELLAEACRAPSVEALKYAIGRARELHLGDQALSGARGLLEALLHLSASLEVASREDARSAPLLSAVAAARALGANEVTCPELAAAMLRLRELALKGLEQAKTRAAIKAALDVAREAGADRAEIRAAEEILQLLEGLARACIQCAEDELRRAVAAADLVDFDKAACAEYQRAKEQLAAHELLRQARMPDAGSQAMEAAIEAAKKAGLSASEYESAGNALSRARLEENIREKCTRAERQFDVDELERAVDAAQLVGLQDLEDCLSAKRMLHRLRAAEELRQASEEPVSSARLRTAWEAGLHVGLDDRGRALPDEVHAVVARARQLVHEEGVRDEARARLDAALRAGDLEQVTVALEAARTARVTDLELAHAEAWRRREEDRLEAERREEERRREEEQRDEERRRQEEEERREAQGAVQRACRELGRSALRAALEAAERAGLASDDVGRARELFDGLERLQMAAGGASLDELRAVVEEFGDGEVNRSVEFAACKEKLKTEEAREKERQRKAQAEREQLERRMKEQAAARQAAGSALAAGASEALQAALQQAKSAALPREELEALEEALREAVAEEAKRFGAVRAQLEEALAPLAPLQRLEEAVIAAERAKLPSSDPLYRQARDLLAQKREAMRMLKSALNAQELKAALEVSRQAGLSTCAEYAEAKAAYDRAKDAAKRTQHLEHTRRGLEDAVRLGNKEALERAIREARLLNMDSSEWLLKQAVGKLREVMVEHIQRLVKKVSLGLKEGTLDKKRLDDMEEAKDEIVSARKVAKDVDIGEADLEDIERLRKKLHNIVEDLKGSVRVFCRVRPLSSKERGQGDSSIASQVDPMSLEIKEKKQTVDGKKKIDKHMFHFDAVFSPGTQEAIFADCKELVQSALDGRNVTIFAYGQTGAGKTYTMTGEAGDEGIAPSTIDEMYRVMDLNKSRVTYSVRASITELYCNNFVDLLRKSSGQPQEAGIDIRWDKDAGEVVVDGLSEQGVSSSKDLRALFTKGQDARRVAHTQMNLESSRSHLIMTIKVTAENRETGERLRGKVVLVDLAGSERIKKSKPTPEQQTEAIEINKSLTALVDVIEALVQNQRERNASKQKIVPYRNHKLTQFLQDTLGGTAKVLMFVNCSPADSNLAETLSSLRYASRAKTITNAKPADYNQGDPDEALARSRPLMARLRTTRSNENLSRFKTFHEDDVCGAEGGVPKSASAETIGTTASSEM